MQHGLPWAHYGAWGAAGPPQNVVQSLPGQRPLQSTVFCDRQSACRCWRQKLTTSLKETLSTKEKEKKKIDSGPCQFPSSRYKAKARLGFQLGHCSAEQEGVVLDISQKLRLLLPFLNRYPDRDFGFGG